MSQDKVTVGRIVQVAMDDGGYLAGVVTDVFEQGVIEVQLFVPLRYAERYGHCVNRVKVEHDETGSRPLTWRWPPRV